ncbi:MAG: insulinase family protein, partial [Mesorhizobium sp.]
MRGAPAWHQQHSVQHPSTVLALRANPPSPTRGEGRAARVATPLVTLLLSLVFLVLPALSARAAMSIQEVTSSKGITAWLVEDYSVPLVAIRFVFDGGTTQDPAGKEGLANLMSGLFDEGAGNLDSESFQIKLDDVGAEMS